MRKCSLDVEKINYRQRRLELAEAYNKIEKLEAESEELRSALLKTYIYAGRDDDKVCGVCGGWIDYEEHEQEGKSLRQNG